MAPFKEVIDNIVDNKTRVELQSKLEMLARETVQAHEKAEQELKRANDAEKDKVSHKFSYISSNRRAREFIFQHECNEREKAEEEARQQSERAKGAEDAKVSQNISLISSIRSLKG